jgi:hypothetical protein
MRLFIEGGGLGKAAEISPPFFLLAESATNSLQTTAKAKPKKQSPKPVAGRSKQEVSGNN